MAGRPAAAAAETLRPAPPILTQRAESEDFFYVKHCLSEAMGSGFPALEAGHLSDDGFDAGDMDGMEAKLEELRLHHRTLDMRIEALELEGGQLFQVMTLKREKLRVKDKIAWLTTKLTPDIIA
jgi:hypothetical protein